MVIDIYLDGRQPLHSYACVITSVSDDLKTKFPCLGILVEIYLVMAVSTAICERGFSCMKRVKSDWRSTLGGVQLSRLMYLSLEGPSLAQFQAAPAVSRWWGSGERTRRPGSGARVNQPTEADIEQELEEIEADLRRE